eukprot:COSAG02_NODE_5425_length_4343_cov_2.410697_3_plen_40_part_00
MDDNNGIQRIGTIVDAEWLPASAAQCFRQYFPILWVFPA